MVEGDGRWWKGMEGDGRRWKMVEGDGRGWKAMACTSKLLRSAATARSASLPTREVKRPSQTPHRSLTSFADACQEEIQTCGSLSAFVRLARALRARDGGCAKARAGWKLEDAYQRVRSTRSVRREQRRNVRVFTSERGSQVRGTSQILVRAEGRQARSSGCRERGRPQGARATAGSVCGESLRV